LLDVAAASGSPDPAPADREAWARLAQRLGVRAIHIAEHDTQVGATRRTPGEFVNTWPREAFVDEGTQPAELGWGSHERHFPPDGAWHASGSAASIHLERPGAGTCVRSWTPLGGPMHGWLITHAESISIADYMTLGAGRRPDYRPTVHYAQHPCDDAVLSLHALAARQWHIQPRTRLLRDDITSGIDELGVLLMGPARGSYWYGSQRSIDEARRLAPASSATGLQMAAGVLAGAVWALRNPARGTSRLTNCRSTNCWRWPRPTSARWWAPGPTGPRWQAEAGPSTRISIATIPVSSRTSAWIREAGVGAGPATPPSSRACAGTSRHRRRAPWLRSNRDGAAGSRPRRR
jgi:homospermidine synthase